MTEAPWVPPSDPDFVTMEQECYRAWARDAPSIVAFDTETSGLEWFDDAFCVTVAWRGEQGLEAHYLELVKHDTRPLTIAILEQADTLIGHNLKFDLHRVINLDLFDARTLPRKTLHDTECAAHLDDEHRRKGLKVLAVDLLGVDVETVEVPIKSGPNKGKTRLEVKEAYEIGLAKKWAKKEYGYATVNDFGYDVLPRGVVAPYAIKDALYTYMLFEYLFPLVERYPDTMLKKYHEEMRTTRTFLDMEASGLGVDTAYVERTIKEYAGRLLQHELKIEGIVGRPVRTGKIPAKERDSYFNPQSNTDIPAFFGRAGFKREKYDEESLRTIPHPLAEALLELRGDAKILNTYLRALKRGTREGVFHPSIRQHGTVTGRTSSGAAKGDS
jgi:DNA polymerase I-like protein with 3'-5' exonuclease and polymerase domains